MIKAVHISRNGVMAFQSSLNQVAHNISNVYTCGYKKGELVFGDLLGKSIAQRRLPISRAASPPPVEEPRTGAGVASLGTVRYFNMGMIVETNRYLDLAIEGEGFFRVICSDGSVAYTRQGNFFLDARGNLVTARGDRLEVPFSLDNMRPGSLTVDPDGRAFAVALNGERVALGQIRLYRFVNPAGLEAVAGNLYLPTEASGAPEGANPGSQGFGILRQFHLEQSNVDLGREMIQLINAQRALQANARALVTADELWSLTLHAKS